MKDRESKKAWRNARNRVLLSKNPRFENDDPQEALHNTMMDTHEFINASLGLDANPLKYLRKQFPGFEWSFYSGKEGEKFLPSIGKRVQDADYIWHVDRSLTDMGQIITARQIGRKKPRMLFWCSERGSWMHELKQVVPKVRYVLFEHNELVIE